MFTASEAFADPDPVFWFEQSDGNPLRSVEPGTPIDAVHDFGGVFVELSIWQGSLAEAQEGRFTFSVERVQAYVPSAGDIIDVTDRYATLPTYEVALLRNGGRLKAVFVPAGDDPRTPAGFLENTALAHVRHECD